MKPAKIKDRLKAILMVLCFFVLNQTYAQESGIHRSQILFETGTND